MESFVAARSWKWVVGLVYIIVAVLLGILGRIGWVDAAVLIGIGVILL